MNSEISWPVFPMTSGSKGDEANGQGRSEAIVPPDHRLPASEEGDDEKEGRAGSQEDTGAHPEDEICRDDRHDSDESRRDKTDEAERDPEGSAHGDSEEHEPHRGRQEHHDEDDPSEEPEEEQHEEDHSHHRMTLALKLLGGVCALVLAGLLLATAVFRGGRALGIISRAPDVESFAPPNSSVLAHETSRQQQTVRYYAPDGTLLATLEVGDTDGPWTPLYLKVVPSAWRSYYRSGEIVDAIADTLSAPSEFEDYLLNKAVGAFPSGASQTVPGVGTLQGYQLFSAEINPLLTFIQGERQLGVGALNERDGARTLVIVTRN